MFGTLGFVQHRQLIELLVRVRNHTLQKRLESIEPIVDGVAIEQIGVVVTLDQQRFALIDHVEPQVIVEIEPWAGRDA